MFPRGGSTDREPVGSSSWTTRFTEREPVGTRARRSDVSWGSRLLARCESTALAGDPYLDSLGV
jgi:hypothetical protein